jgi:hypothetical protein
MKIVGVGFPKATALHHHFEDSTTIRHKMSPLAHLLVTGKEINAMHLGLLEPRGQ